MKTTTSQFSDEDILNVLGLSSELDETKKQQVVDSVRISAEAQYGNMLADTLSDQQFDELEQLIESDTPSDEIEDWVGKAIPNKNELRERILQESVQNIKAHLDSILS